jgi:elongation factor Ts
MIEIEKIKKLREETNLSISECKKALESCGGDLDKARAILKQSGKKISEKIEKKETSQGIISSYVHSNKKVGAMLELFCETDFVAKSAEFENLAHEICLQIAANPFSDIPLIDQPWIKNQSMTIGDLLKEYIAKFGENIKIGRFVRFEI